jgi:hypothetical protein
MGEAVPEDPRRDQSKGCPSHVRKRGQNQSTFSVEPRRMLPRKRHGRYRQVPFADRRARLRSELTTRFLDHRNRGSRSRWFRRWGGPHRQTRAHAEGVLGG